MRKQHPNIPVSYSRHKSAFPFRFFGILAYLAQRCDRKLCRCNHWQGHAMPRFDSVCTISIIFNLFQFTTISESSSTTQHGRKFSVRSAGDGSKANQCSAGYEGLNCGLCVFGYFPVTWRKDQLIQTIERYWESMSNEVVRRFQKKCMSCKNFARLCKVQDFQHYCLIYMFIILEFGGILTLDFATLCDHIIQNYIYT